MVKTGTVGASGFLGNRAIELLYADLIDVRAIGRSTASFALLALKNLDCQVVNAFNSSELEAAFRGCDMVIYSILGCPGLIRGSIAPLDQAPSSKGFRDFNRLAQAQILTLIKGTLKRVLKNIKLP